MLPFGHESLLLIARRTLSCVLEGQSRDRSARREGAMGMRGTIQLQEVASDFFATAVNPAELIHGSTFA